MAVVTMDDGKANALGAAMLAALGDACARAERSDLALLLTGREGRFCAGFDLPTMMSGLAAARALVTQGAELLLRLHGFARPVVVACTGHALAAGALLLLVADTRIGVDAPAKIGLNEVSIAMPLPLLARELARERLDPRQLLAATVQAQIYSPRQAVEVGYLDRLVDAGALMAVALTEAQRLAALPRDAYALTKRGLRRATTALIRDTLADDMAELTAPTG